MTPLEVAVRVERQNFTLDFQHDFHPGEVTAIIGPNGSGKTTLLQAVAGFIPAQSGSIRAGKQVWFSTESSSPTAVPTYERGASLMPQSASLFPHLTVAENILFGPRNQRVEDPQGILDYWANRLHLKPLLTRKPNQLSGGQAQRVALARAFAAGPAVLLLDEPASSLDVAGSANFREVLAEQLSLQPTTTLLVTHSSADVLDLAGHVVVLENGRLVTAETTRSLWCRPPAGFASKFTGINTLAAHVCKSKPHARVKFECGLEWYCPDVAQSLRGATVTVSVSPDSVRLRDRHVNSVKARNVWTATVTHISAANGGFLVRLDQPKELEMRLSPKELWEHGVRVGGVLDVSVFVDEVLIDDRQV